MGLRWPGIALSGLSGGGGERGGGLVGCVQSRGLCARASPSGVYPVGRLQWHFACGFDFGHVL